MAGRKSPYEEGLHCNLVEGYMRDGLTEREAAEAMRISYPTLLKWKRLHLPFQLAIEKGRLPYKITVENKLASMALDDNNFNAVKVILERRFPDDWKEKKEEHLHVTGDNDDLKRDLMRKMLSNWSDDEAEEDGKEEE